MLHLQVYLTRSDSSTMLQYTLPNVNPTLRKNHICLVNAGSWYPRFRAKSISLPEVTEDDSSGVKLDRPYW